MLAYQAMVANNTPDQTPVLGYLACWVRFSLRLFSAYYSLWSSLSGKNGVKGTPSNSREKAVAGDDTSMEPASPPAEQIEQFLFDFFARNYPKKAYQGVYLIRESTRHRETAG